MQELNLVDQELYHNIELDLAEAFLEIDSQMGQSLAEVKNNKKTEDKIKSLKEKLG